MNQFVEITHNGMMYIPECRIGNYSRFTGAQITCFVRVDSKSFTTLYFYLTNEKEVKIILNSMRDEDADAKIVIPQNAPMFVKYPNGRDPLTDLELDHLVMMVDMFARENGLEISIE